MKTFTIPWHHFSAPLPARSQRHGGEFTLAKGEVRSLKGGDKGMEIGCREGCIWLTQQNNGGDVVLRSGESFRVNGTGLVVIEALRKASVGAS